MNDEELITEGEEIFSLIKILKNLNNILNSLTKTISPSISIMVDADISGEIQLDTLRSAAFVMHLKSYKEDIVKELNKRLNKDDAPAPRLRVFNGNYSEDYE